MKSFLIAVCGLLCLVGQSVSQPASVEVYTTVPAYYWRDYTGLIPNNAIKAGVDENGATTYIGQFSVPAEYNVNKSGVHTVPAVIKVGYNLAFAAYRDRVVRNNESSNAKIFCYDTESRYKWYPSTSVFPPGCRYVIGGNEDAVPMFFGRANHNNETVVGKLFSDTTVHRNSLISPYNGSVLFHSTYEVLTHCS